MSAIVIVCVAVTVPVKPGAIDAIGDPFTVALLSVTIILVK